MGIFFSILGIIAVILLEYFGNLYNYNLRIKSIKDNFKNVIPIEFDKFVKFYRINPNKYNFSRINTNFKWRPDFIIYHPTTDKISYAPDNYRLIFIKYREYKKFLRFYKKLKEKMNDGVSDETMMGYLNDVQRDIDDLKRQKKSYINKSLEISSEIKDRRRNNV